MKKRFGSFPSVRLAGLAMVLMILAGPGCAVRTTKVHPALIPAPAQNASTPDLVSRVNISNEQIRTLTATVDLEPTAGSVYSGIIKEYHDVRGFILFEKPATIRMVGQAPVVGVQIFDMVSEDEEFRVYVPTKDKFIVGKNSLHRRSNNSLENLRPQHILDALVIPPVASAGESHFREEAQDGNRRYYVLTVLDPAAAGELSLKRKIWFDRSDLSISRLQIYGLGGAYVEDVKYSNYQNYDGVRYPSRIEIHRPIEDYRLTITIQKAVFNQPLGPEKFELKRPDSAQLVDLATAEEPGGQ